ncbi:MAG: hypothetical protein CME70_06210 [Halobacteriovorax sp.]|nr:hypothetical protein [Halobacteriovorax sp.]|tara:strand:- start:1207 stop:1617 length:411 start_codon:yes stop_codon:yes gene_type:complete
MAKLSRSQLKSIVKECLVEILEEGLTGQSQSTSALKESRDLRARPTTRTQSRPTKQFESAVNRTVNALTSDSTMASIFADTAATTLQEQQVHEPRSNVKSDIIDTPSVESVDDTFGEAAQNWAALAFSDAKKTEGN